MGGAFPRAIAVGFCSAVRSSRAPPTAVLYSGLAGRTSAARPKPGRTSARSAAGFAGGRSYLIISGHSPRTPNVAARRC